MINFQTKYLPGNVFDNSLANGFAELIMNLVAGVLYRVGIKKSYLILFGLSVIGGTCIILVGADNQALMPVFVMIAKGGISGGFLIAYVCTMDVFPTLFCATALGCCNFMARFLTILAPEIAEQPPPLPMALFTILIAIGIIIVQFVRPLPKNN